MRDDELDDVLKQTPGVDPALVDRVTRSIGASLQPVRPLPPLPFLAAAAALVSAGAALAGAVLFGFAGVRRMDAPDIAILFPILGLLFSLAALVACAQMIPGSRRPIAPGMLLAGCCVSLAVVFVILFKDYGMDDFWRQGIRCLIGGLAVAAPAAVIVWLLLRRGFAVNSAAAGFAQGTLAGLAGVCMLEFHCANFTAPHILLWHIAVLPIAAAAGALLGKTRG